MAHFPPLLRTLPPFEEKRYGPGDWYHVPARAEHAARFETETSEIEFWFHQP